MEDLREGKSGWREYKIKKNEEKGKDRWEKVTEIRIKKGRNIGRVKEWIKKKEGGNEGRNNSKEEQISKGMN